MSDREEWTEWFLHDGKGCPCKGMVAHMVFDSIGAFPNGTMGTEIIDRVRGGAGWFWDSGPNYGRIIRYRTKRPRALIQLREMIETLPAPSRKEDAHV